VVSHCVRAKRGAGESSICDVRSTMGSPRIAKTLDEIKQLLERPQAPLSDPRPEDRSIVCADENNFGNRSKILR